MSIRCEIILEAPAERIWDLMTDCGLYPQWNPLFTEARGSLKAGERLELVVSLPGIAPFTVAPTVSKAVPQSEFCWRHTMLFSGLFSWEYGVELHVLDHQRLKVVQHSRFGGILGPLFALGLQRAVADGLASLNDALRRWGEKGNIRCHRC